MEIVSGGGTSIGKLKRGPGPLQYYKMATGSVLKSLLKKISLHL
jgi:hypothetical protein